MAALPDRSDSAWPNYLATTVQPIRFHPIHVVNAYQLFRSSPIDLSALSSTRPREVQALCWSAFSVNQLLARLALGLQGATLARLGRLNTSWANYRAYGYTRQALEQIVFRGRATVHDTLPGQVQWLLGHLSVGEEVQWRDSTTTATSTVVELFGGLRYWHDFTQYSGASAIIALPNSGRPGFGRRAGSGGPRADHVGGCLRLAGPIEARRRQGDRDCQRTRPARGPVGEIGLVRIDWRQSWRLAH